MTRTSFALALVVALAGCGGDEEITVGRGAGDGPPTTGRSTTSAAAEPEAPAETEAEAAAAVVPLSYRDEDFVETDGNRDPFRNYAAMFLPTVDENIRVVRERVVMPDTPVEEMHLIAIVTGVASPRAMIEDGHGTGYTVQRGDFLGREDVVTTGGTGGLPVTLNWRVDRIHSDAIVLTRDDPTAANRVPLTRVIPLHPEVAEGG